MYTKDNEEDVAFIEKLYADIEQGFRSCGKEYKRPEDYVERALRVMNSSAKRGRLHNQYEGKKGHYNEDN